MSESPPVMTIGSLCSGYGGLDMAAVAHYGGEVRWVSDNYPGCVTLLASHHPTIPNLGDLTEVNWADVEPPDLVTAGFPCQPVSYASILRKGLHDDRWIWDSIAEALRILEPRRVLLENVPGLLTANGGHAICNVLHDLSRLGFDAEYGIVRASDPPVFAPHKRARWFCVATNTARPERRIPQLETVDTSARRAAESGKRDRPPPVCNDNSLIGPRATTDPDERRRQDFRTWDRLGAAGDAQSFAAAFGPYGAAIERWANCLGRNPPYPTDERGIRPEFVEFLMGLDAGHVCGLDLSRTDELHILGNGVVWQQAALALTLLDPLNHDQEAR